MKQRINNMPGTRLLALSRSSCTSSGRRRDRERKCTCSPRQAIISLSTSVTCPECLSYEPSRRSGCRLRKTSRAPRIHHARSAAARRKTACAPYHLAPRRCSHIARSSSRMHCRRTQSEIGTRQHAPRARDGLRARVTRGVREYNIYMEIE